MSKRRQNIMILVGLLALAFIGGFAYWLWVKSIALPILGEIDDEYETVTVSDEAFKTPKKKIKLISVAESGCPSNCEKKFELLETVQQDLIEEKAFVERVFILTIVEDEADRSLFKNYLKTYNVDESGWKIISLEKNDHKNLLEQIEKSKENDGWLTLVDANGRIRQHYNIENKNEKEQLIKDVKQLIRIQQQTIEERRQRN